MLGFVRDARRTTILWMVARSGVGCQGYYGDGGKGCLLPVAAAGYRWRPRKRSLALAPERGTE